MAPKPTPTGEVPKLLFHDGFIRRVSLIDLDFHILTNDECVLTGGLNRSLYLLRHARISGQSLLIISSDLIMAGCLEVMKTSEADMVHISIYGFFLKVRMS